LAVLPFLFSAFMKVSGNPQMLEGVAHLGWSAGSITTLAILEITCVVLYLIPPVAVLGAILLTGYLGGAIATHMRIGEPVFLHIAIGILIWLALFIRESRLREILPVRGKGFDYEREITIARSSDVVFKYIKSLKNFDNWNPFIKKDPQLKKEYRGTDGEVGFTAAWNGNREVGAGEQEITRVVEGRKIEFLLRFERPFKQTNTGYFSVESVSATETKVRWGMSGKATFPMTLIGMFMDCDKMIGGQFESGLKELKTILEK
jgi:hypothetical protein